VFLADIRICGKDNVSQILAADKVSPYPWPESIIVRDLIAGDSRVSYVGAFATADENSLLGYAVLGEENENGLLMNLVVVPQHRRRGIGAQLVVAAAELALILGFSKLVLRVRLTNHAAMALYRGLGFSGDTMRGGFYSDGSAARVMSVKLPLDLKSDM